MKTTIAADHQGFRFTKKNHNLYGRIEPLPSMGTTNCNAKAGVYIIIATSHSALHEHRNVNVKFQTSCEAKLKF